MAQDQQSSLGTSHWLHPGLVATLHPWGAGRVWAGRSPEKDDPFHPNAPAIGFDDDRHVLITAGNRSGKGATFIVPNLCLWPGSVLVLDPKGENAMLTAARRGAGGIDPRSGFMIEGMHQATYVLDPYEQARGCEAYRARFNPMAELLIKGTDTPTPDAVDQVNLIVDALVVEKEGGAPDPFWDSAAKDVLRALILHVLSEPSYEGYRNLVTVRRLLMLGDLEGEALMREEGDKNIPSPEELLWRSVANNDAFASRIAGIGRRYLSDLRENYKTYAGVIANAQVHTAFIDSDGLRDNLRESDFRLADLKTDPRGISVFLCLPQRLMRDYFRWMRIIATLATAEMERVAHHPLSGHPVLFMLDEFATLHRMEAIESAVSYIAGFGVKMIFVLQSLDQFNRLYPKSWQTFYANCGLRSFMDIEDNFSCDYISTAAGDTEVSIYNTAESTALGSSTARQEGGARTVTKAKSRGQQRGGSRQNSQGGSTSFSKNESSSTNQSQTTGSGESRVFHKRDFFSRLLGFSEYRTDDDKTASANASQTVGIGRSQGTQHGSGTTWSDSTGESWGENDSVTLSEAIGETWSVTETETTTETKGLNQSRQKRRLVAPEEVRRIFKRVKPPHPAYPGLALLFMAGENPTAVRRTHYFEDSAFAGLFTPHHDHPIPVRPALPEPPPAPAVVPPPKLPYAVMGLRALAVAVPLTAATIALLVLYCTGLVDLQIYLSERASWIDVNSGLVLWVMTVGLASFLLFTRRDLRAMAITAAIVAVVIGMAWSGLVVSDAGQRPWNYDIERIVVSPVLFFWIMPQIIRSGEPNQGTFVTIAVVVSLVMFAIWFALIFVRYVNQHRHMISRRT